MTDRPATPRPALRALLAEAPSAARVMEVAMRVIDASLGIDGSEPHLSGSLTDDDVVLKSYLRTVAALRNEAPALLDDLDRLERELAAARAEVAGARRAALNEAASRILSLARVGDFTPLGRAALREGADELRAVADHQPPAAKGPTT